MLLVFSLDKPPWDGQMATRFLVSAEASDLQVTVLLNKADLVSEERRLQVQAQVAEPHVLLDPLSSLCILCSSQTVRSITVAQHSRKVTASIG